MYLALRDTDEASKYHSYRSVINPPFCCWSSGRYTRELRINSCHDYVYALLVVFRISAPCRSCRPGEGTKACLASTGLGGNAAGSPGRRHELRVRTHPDPAHRGGGRRRPEVAAPTLTPERGARVRGPGRHRHQLPPPRQSSCRRLVRLLPPPQHVAGRHLDPAAILICCRRRTTWPPPS